MTQPTLFTFANVIQESITLTNESNERKIIRESQHFENEAEAKQFAIDAHNSGKYVVVEYCSRTVATEREE